MKSAPLGSSGAVRDATLAVVPSPALHDEIDRLTKNIDAELVEFRRDLHRHPELGRRETRTTAAIVNRLTQAGLEPRVLESGTGVICDILGDLGEAPTVGFRGDIDALPLDDVKDVPYRSTVDGVCHACGHDAHTAIVLGHGTRAGRAQRAGLLTRSVRLIFQPAEEITPGGALDVIADGGTHGLEQVFALHCDPKLEVGTVGFRAGPITAGADRICVTTARSRRAHRPAAPHRRPGLRARRGRHRAPGPAVSARRPAVRAEPGLGSGPRRVGRQRDPAAGLRGGHDPLPRRRCLGVPRTTSCPTWSSRLAAPYGVDVDIDMHTSVPPCVNDEAADGLPSRCRARHARREARPGDRPEPRRGGLRLDPRPYAGGAGPSRSPEPRSCRCG